MSVILGSMATNSRSITRDRRTGRVAQVAHVFSPAIAAKVEMMVAQGINQETIAFACDVSVDTLARHYKEQLQKGLLNANARMTAAIFNTALGEKIQCLDCRDGDTPGIKKDGEPCRTCFATGFIWRHKPDTTAQVWWSKNRMGWTDKERIEHVGDKGGPIMTEQVSSADVVRQKLLQIRKRTANDQADGS